MPRVRPGRQLLSNIAGQRLLSLLTYSACQKRVVELGSRDTVVDHFPDTWHQLSLVEWSELDPQELLPRPATQAFGHPEYRLLGRGKDRASAHGDIEDNQAKTCCRCVGPRPGRSPS